MNYQEFARRVNAGERLLYGHHLVVSVEEDQAYCACCGLDVAHRLFYDAQQVRPLDSGVLGLVFTRHEFSPEQRKAMQSDFGADGGEIGPVVLSGADRDLAVDDATDIVADIKYSARRVGASRVLLYGVIPAPLREAFHLAEVDKDPPIELEVYEAINSRRSAESGPRTFEFVRWAYVGRYRV